MKNKLLLALLFTSLSVSLHAQYFRGPALSFVRYGFAKYQDIDSVLTTGMPSDTIFQFRNTDRFVDLVCIDTGIFVPVKGKTVFLSQKSHKALEHGKREFFPVRRVFKGETDDGLYLRADLFRLDSIGGDSLYLDFILIEGRFLKRKRVKSRVAVPINQLYGYRRGSNGSFRSLNGMILITTGLYAAYRDRK